LSDAFTREAGNVRSPLNANTSMPSGGARPIGHGITYFAAWHPTWGDTGPEAGSDFVKMLTLKPLNHRAGKRVHRNP
jgi:hypothetical protein